MYVSWERVEGFAWSSNSWGRICVMSSPVDREFEVEDSSAVVG